jgi:hypothetical protein
MCIKSRHSSSSTVASATRAGLRPSPYHNRQRVVVKKLPHLQNGKLETILLPVVRNTSDVRAKVTASNALAMEEEEEEKMVIVKREMEEDSNMVFVTVKQEQPEYDEEYAGTTDDDEEFHTVPRKNSANIATTPNAKKVAVDMKGTQVFIKTLLHALDCG